jgi:hypothetical protein
MTEPTPTRVIDFQRVIEPGRTVESARVVEYAAQAAPVPPALPSGATEGPRRLNTRPDGSPWRWWR